MGKRITIDELLKRQQVEEQGYQDASAQIEKYRNIRDKKVKALAATRRKFNRYLREIFPAIWDKYFDCKCENVCVHSCTNKILEIVVRNWQGGFGRMHLRVVLKGECELKDVFDKKVKLSQNEDIDYITCEVLTIGEQCLSEV